MITRREFLRHTATGAAALACAPFSFGQDAAPAAAPSVSSFFIVGDTHYCADSDEMTKMDDVSAGYNTRLVEWLNRLPGTERSAEIGGGPVPAPQGVIHAGDLIHNGDKTGANLKMAETELAAFLSEWGLNGGDGK